MKDFDVIELQQQRKDLRYKAQQINLKIKNKEDFLQKTFYHRKNSRVIWEIIHCILKPSNKMLIANVN